MTGRKRLLLLVSLVALVAIAPGVALADPRPALLQWLRDDTAGWSNFGGGTIRREPSGYTNSGGYAAGSRRRAVLGTRGWARTEPRLLPIGGGPQPVYGAHHELGRLQLDLPDRWIHHPCRHLPRRSGRPRTPTSDSTGRPRSTTRPVSIDDFVFNVGTEPLGFVISGSNNATRCGATPRTRGARPFP